MNNYYVIAVIGIIAVSGAVLAWHNPFQQDTADTGEVQDEPAAATTSGLMIKGATELPYIRNQSDRIVAGTVTSVGDAYRDDQSPVIDVYHDVTVAVNTTYKGEETEQVTIHVPGGTIDGKTYHVTETASFSTGESVLVFLREDGDKHSVVSGSYGKFMVRNSTQVRYNDERQTVDELLS